MTKILLVDDSAIDRRLFAELLEKESDFNVESCNDGKAALEAMSVSSPDVVLTDMQMPEMDGLELVTRIREEHSDVPVILITGHGSEGLATKALRAGAAGYVPKSHSSEVLVDTVQHVLALANSDHIDDSIHSTMSLIHYELELTNDELMIPKVLQLVRKRLEDCTSCDSADRLQIEVALEHAIQNAIYHGNLEF